MDGLFTIGIVLLGIILVGWLFYNETKRKHEEWSGVLEEKKINKYLYKGKERVDCFLYFRTDAGKKVKYSVTEEIFNSFAKGDRAEKRQNDYYPLKEG